MLPNENYAVAGIRKSGSDEPALNPIEKFVRSLWVF